MTKNKNKITIVLTQRERDLIDHHTFADPDYIKRFKLNKKNTTTLSAQFSPEELEDLLGYVAAEANHSKSKKLQKELDALYEKLQELDE